MHNATVQPHATSSAIDSLFRRASPVIDRRAVHLDLKGCAPTPDRLMSLLDLFAAARYNAILVEWEDRFPWTVDRRFRCAEHYGEDVVDAFHRRAAELGFEIIPLVQTLGHMENVLQFDDYAALREVPGRIDGLNPLAEGAGDLLQRMIDDVLAKTPGVRHFHLGGDEAWTFGTHPDTRAFIDRHGAGALLLRLLEPLCDRLIDRGIRPMIWHDMIRQCEPDDLKRIAGKADVVVWGYRGTPMDDDRRHFAIGVIERLHAAGVTLWAGGAYKGPDGFSCDLPEPDERRTNTLGWMDVAGRLNFKGVIATAWSRSETKSPQKAPIDAALDVLIETGVILHDGAPPIGGLEACTAALDALGERDRFEKCRAVMDVISEQRRLAWLHAQWLQEQLVLRRTDPTSLTTGRTEKYWRYFNTHLDRLDAAGREMRDVFAGLLSPVTIDEYLATRIEPLRDQHALMKPKLEA